MTQKMWLNELEKYLYLLPQKESKEIIQYFEEVFADYKDQGYGDNEIIRELGDPKEVAKSMVSSYLDDNDSETKEEIKEEKRTVEKEKFGQKFKRGVDYISESIVGFTDSLFKSGKHKKNKTKLNDEEKSNYEREINEMLKKQEKYAEEASRKDDELEKVKEERDLLKKKLKQEEEERAKMQEDLLNKQNEKPAKVEIEVVSNPKHNYKEMKANSYTVASRHGFVSNFLFTIFMLLIAAFGAFILAYAISFIVNDITLCSNSFRNFFPFTANKVMRLGTFILLFSGELLLTGIAILIIELPLRSIFRRFFVKRHRKVGKNA